MSLFALIKSNVSIFDVASSYVRLRRAGNYWKGPCPFHHETDASFTISPEKGIFYCFGCHAGGDVIAFLAKAENIAPYEAVQQLIDRYKISIPPEVLQESRQNITASTQEKTRYFTLCEAAAAYMHSALLRDTAALSYVKNRGITEAMIKLFMIGYMPGGMRASEQFIKAMSSQGVMLKDLLFAGILLERGGVYVSPFEERIMFPIYDALGRVCGFGGRVFRLGDERAKYYNSKDLPYFSKGKLLFGFSHAKKAIHDEQSAFLVEGYTDCVAMVQHGYANTVATLGTACTLDHLKMLSRHLKTLYVLYDGDSAGRKAIMRLAEFCWEANIELAVVCLPAKEDPDSFLAKGGDLRELVAKARDIFSFFIASVAGDAGVKTVSQRYEISKRLVEVVARVQDQFKRELLLQQAATCLQVPLDSLRSLAEGGRVASVVQESASELAAQGQVVVPPLEKALLTAILHNVEQATITPFPDDLIPYLAEPTRKVYEAVLTIRHESPCGERFAALLESLSDELRGWVRSCVMSEDGVLTDEQYALYLDMLRRQTWKQMVQDMKQSLRQAEQEHDEEKFRELMRGFVALHQMMKDKRLL